MLALPCVLSKQTETEEEAPQEAKDLRDEKFSDEIDDMLDEIDGVLESNADDFVKSYVQKGGE